MKLSDQEIVSLIHIGNESVFQYLYKQYYQAMYTVAFYILKDDYAAKSVISDIFTKIWERRDSFQINGSVRSYLIVSIRNLSINYLKQKYIRDKIGYGDLKSPLLLISDETPIGQILEQESVENIRNMLSSLPEQTKEVFWLSRVEGLKYQEIAERMALSPNTVKYHITRALNILREKLILFLPIFLLKIF